MSKMRVVQVTHSNGAFALVERDKVRNASKACSMNGISSTISIPLRSSLRSTRGWLWLRREVFQQPARAKIDG